MCIRDSIVAAGTSMHAGFVGKQMFEQLAGIPTEVHISSEFVYNTPVISQNPLFIFISQSGETADSRAVLVKIKQLGYKSLTSTNVPGSTLSREADHTLLSVSYTHLLHQKQILNVLHASRLLLLSFPDELNHNYD